MLLLEGPMRVTDAAARLGVSPSTAHRLLAMLVYRDFAEQDADKRYRPGRLLHGSPRPPSRSRRCGRPPGRTCSAWSTAPTSRRTWWC
nr:helix-turn-helix domain-containing protein [Nocardioides soli]